MTKDTTTGQKETPAQKEKPVHKLRAGALDVAVWRREGQNGPFYSVTTSRSYRQGEEWKQADSYGADDLLHLAELLRQAWAWIISQPKREAD
jgi:hypothetical protein